MNQTKKESVTLTYTQANENRIKDLARVYEGLQMYVLATDVAGRIVYVNEYTCHQSGYAKKEMEGRMPEEFFTPDEDTALQERQAAQRVILCQLLTAGGEMRTLRLHTMELLNDKKESVGLLKIGEDISENKTMLKALQRSNEALQDLFDHSHDLIFICTTHGKLLFANKAFQYKLGYEADELVGLNINDLILPREKKNTYRQILKIIRSEPQFRFETILVSKKGRQLHLKGMVTCRYENDQPSALRAILKDITDKVRAEKAQTLYYSIGNLTVRSKNLNQLYHNIHQELSKVIDVKNFYIKLYDSLTDELFFPYYVDEARDMMTKINKRKAGKGMTDYVMKGGKAVFLYEEEIDELIKAEGLQLFGPLPKIWIGVPLKFQNQVIGLISVKCYRSRNTYTSSDLELLDFISGQIALAIERKRYEERINNQSARLKAIFESSSHLMWSMNRNFKLTSFNKNYSNSILKQYGILPEIDTPLMHLKQVMEKNETYLFWLEKYTQAFQGEIQHFEMKLQMQDGQTRWREVYLNPIRLEDGSIEEVSAIAHDITEKKHSEIALTESELQFRNIFESFQDIYYQARLDGTFTLVSPSVFEIIGFEPSEVIGKKITDFIVSNENFEMLIKRLLKLKKIKNYETVLRTRSGALVSSISNIKVVYDSENQPIGIEGVVRDITELKKAAEEVLKAKDIAEKSLRVKQSFLANMSHEIRTPMNGIIGMVDLMLMTSLDKLQKDYMQTIKKSSEALLHILNDILDLSKIEAGKMRLQNKVFSLRQTLEKVYTLYLQQASSKQINLEYEVNENIPAYILADETRLMQIITNLLSNAIKFTENGNIRLLASLQKQKQESIWIKLEVIDSGIGIDKENLKLLFEHFSQLDDSYSKTHAGTGLGLAISKQLSTLLNGEIGVESEPGKGSNFWFTFEASVVTMQENEEVQTENELLETELTLGYSPRILVVDDNLVNRKVAGEILKTFGCQVEQAASGEEAIEKVKNFPPFHLIFMDIQMPGMDGVAATQYLKSLGIQDLPPIIAMTAYSMQEDRERFLNQGLDGYIPKPVTAQSLLQQVKKYTGAPGKESKKQSSNLKQPESGNLLTINLRALDQLAKYGGATLVNESLGDFINDTSDLLQQATQACKKTDLNELKSIMHTLKGNAGTLGAELLSEKAKYIEFAIKNEQSLPWELEMEKIFVLFEEFKNHLKLLHYGK